MEDYQKLSYCKEVIEFVAVAKEYCDFIERGIKMERKDFINSLQKFLPLVYLKGSLLPAIEVDTEGLAEDFITENDYNYLYQNLYTLLGEYDEFLDVFDDAMQYSEEPIVQSISEKLCDIYQDLKNFISSFRCGVPEIMDEALWTLNSNFELYWGKHSAALIRAVHTVVYKLADEN